MPLVKFGVGGNAYDFTQQGIYLQDYDDNFGDRADNTAEFGGMDGVFLVDGNQSGRKPAGNITQSLKIVATSREEIDVKRQALLRITNLGLQPLIYQQSNSTDATLFTYAKAQVQAPRSQQNQSDLFQNATIRFLVPDPYWYASTQGYILGVNFLMGASTLGGNPVVINASGTQSDEIVSNGGTARTLVQVQIAPDTGQTCEDPIVQRLVGGVVHDQVSYTGTLTDTDVLLIDPGNLSGPQVTLNGSDAFDTDFDFKHPRWMSLLPGDNDIRVIFANGGDDAIVTLTFLDAYEGS